MATYEGKLKKATENLLRAHTVVQQIILYIKEIEQNTNKIYDRDRHEGELLKILRMLFIALIQLDSQRKKIHSDLESGLYKNNLKYYLPQTTALCKNVVSELRSTTNSIDKQIEYSAQNTFKCPGYLKKIYGILVKSLIRNLNDQLVILKELHKLLSEQSYKEDDYAELLLYYSELYQQEWEILADCTKKIMRGALGKKVRIKQ